MTFISFVHSTYLLQMQIKSLTWMIFSHDYIYCELKSSKNVLIIKWNSSRYLCLVLLQVPKNFGLVQIFCAKPKIYLYIVAVKNILCQTKRWFAFSKIGFCASTKVIEEALNAVKFLGWLKIFGKAQNILGPVKGQGIIWFQKGLVLMLIFFKNLCS